MDQVSHSTGRDQLLGPVWCGVYLWFCLNAISKFALSGTPLCRQGCHMQCLLVALQNRLLTLAVHMRNACHSSHRQ